MLVFCILNEGGTKIKVAIVLKDYGNIKVRGFFAQEWNNIPDAMVLRYVRFMRRPIICCNRQQRWPYKILIEKFQELEERQNFNVTIVFEYFHIFETHDKCKKSSCTINGIMM